MSLRKDMPTVAWLVDELRRQWGVAETDSLVRRSMHGQGSMALGRMHALETGPDGVEREFGQRVAAVVQGKGGAWSR